MHLLETQLYGLGDGLAHPDGGPGYPRPSMTSFAETTAVTQMGDNHFGGTMPSGWDIGGVANGGMTLAYAVRAMLASTSKPDPLSVTAHYLRPVMVGPLDIHIDPSRDGRTLTTLAATMTQKDKNGVDKEVLRVVGSFADLGAMSGPKLLLTDPPDLCPVEESILVRPQTEPGYPPAFVTNFDIAYDPKYAFFLDGPVGTPTMGGHLRLRNDEPHDAAALAMFADSFPPTIFNTDIPAAWAPTVELTVHFRAHPVPGWLRGTYATEYISGGLFSGDLTLWDEADNLIVQARQIALLPKAG